MIAAFVCALRSSLIPAIRERLMRLPSVLDHRMRTESAHAVVQEPLVGAAALRSARDQEKTRLLRKIKVRSWGATPASTLVDALAAYRT